MKKLKTRMLFFIVLPTLLCFAIITIYISFKANEIVVQNAEEVLVTNGESLSKDLRLELERTLNSVQTLSHTFEKTISAGETPTRYTANVMLQQLIENNENILSAWMFWEENAFDGQDSQFINSPGHDETGRFLPHWSRNETWGIRVGAMADYDKPGIIQDNLQRVLETGKDTIHEPFLYEIDDKERLITSIVAPVTIKGETVGMTGVDIGLEEFNEFISQFSYYENGYAGLLSNNGNILAHHDTNYIGNNFFESEIHGGMEGIQAAVKIGEPFQSEGFSSLLNTDVYEVFSPIHIEGIDTPWSAYLVASVDEVKKEASSLMVTVSVVSAIGFIVLNILILIVTYDIVKTIRAAVAHGSEMAVGNFTRKVSKNYLKRKDELGDLARIFASIGENMRGLIGKVQNSTEQLLHSADSLNEGGKEAALASNEVAASIEDVASSAERQKRSIDETVKSMEEMTQGIQKVANTASTVSEAANEMNERIDLGQETVSKAVEQMDRIQEETKSTKAVIEQLDEGADEIESIVSIITSISEQTNLLALNAAIEAARAGDAGKGFAVVADEVRKLADETKRFASHIQKLIDNFKIETTRADDSMNRSEIEVNEGINRIEQVGQAFSQITASIEKVIGEVEELSSVAEEMAAVTEEIAAASDEIASNVETTSNQSQQVASAAEEQLVTMEGLANTSHSLKGLAQELKELQEQFQV